MPEGVDRPSRDQPWLMRTYSGHSTAKASNELYRANLAKGQTGLSIAFDLPTQTGYDPDDALAHGEVGKVGVPVAHLGHMQTLLDGIPPAEMNTSMTINATAAWMLALYVANAESQGVAASELRGTTQNDIVKEYLSRGTYIFPPDASRRLIVDMVAWCAEHAPKWNPINVCSYHLQEAGATPVQEIAYSLATAIGVLDAVRDSGQVEPAQFAQVYGSISFFVNAGIRFVEEVCKLRALTELWDRDRARALRRDRRARPPVPVRGAGQLARSHRGPAREQRAADRAGDAGRHAVEACQGAFDPTAGMERSAGVAASVGPAVVVANATGAGIRERPVGVRRHLRRLRGHRSQDHGVARRRVGGTDEVLELGGAFEAIDELKGRLVRSMVERTRRIESGQQQVVGVNVFTETAESPLATPGNILTVDPALEAETIADVRAWRAARDARRRCGGTGCADLGCGRRHQHHGPVDRAGQGWRNDGRVGNGVARRVRRVPRPDRRVGSGGRRSRRRSRRGRRACEVDGRVGRRDCWSPSLASTVTRTAPSRSRSPPATPAWRWCTAASARPPAQIVASARDEDPDVVGLSILSGSHLELVPAIVQSLREVGVDAPVIVGGIIPEQDRAVLMAAGVAAIYTPKNFQLAKIMSDIADLAESHRARVTVTMSPVTVGRDSRSLPVSCDMPRPMQGSTGRDSGDRRWRVALTRVAGRDRRPGALARLAGRVSAAVQSCGRGGWRRPSVRGSGWSRSW